MDELFQDGSGQNKHNGTDDSIKAEVKIGLKCKLN